MHTKTIRGLGSRRMVATIGDEAGLLIRVVAYRDANNNIKVGIDAPRELAIVWTAENAPPPRPKPT